MSTSNLRERLLPASVRDRSDRLLGALLAITFLSLLARLLFLGARTAHWDEGRVGYDILRYLRTGAWEYRPIVHGPFLPHVNKLLFGVVGPNDFTARLIVALVGGLLPLTAWLFRERLRNAELVVLALFFTADPILLYYSRFMRNDVLVAAFAVAGLGFFVRLLDTGNARYLFAGTAAFALSFTTKENAILYPVTMLGGLVLLFDHRLFLARAHEEDWVVYAWGRIRAVVATLWRFKIPILIAAVEFFAIFVFFYAPRLAPVGGLGLWEALANPAMLPDVIDAATFGTIDKISSTWIGGPHQKHPYVPFLKAFLGTLFWISGPLLLFAVVGFITDRYGGERPNDLVSLGFYWGVVSIAGYPIATDIKAAWTVTHAVVPLAFPAAAGVALIYRWGRDALAADDRISAGLAALVLLLIAGQVAGTAVATSYVHPQNNDLVQFAQPADDMGPALRSVNEAAESNDGLDVLWFGERFHVENESEANRLPIGDGQWYNRLPIPWYLEAYRATVDSTPILRGISDFTTEGKPPVIITCKQQKNCPTEVVRSRLEDRLGGYRKFVYKGRYFPRGEPIRYIFYVKGEYVRAALEG